MSSGSDHRELLTQSVRALEFLQSRVDSLESERSEPIAIVGIGCRFPGGADSPKAYWELLRNGVDAVSEVPADRWSADDYYDPDRSTPGKMATRWGGFLHQIDRFDAGFFGISPREATSMDPQQRILLEVASEAMEDAGLARCDSIRNRTGVFVGVTTWDHAILNSSRAHDPLFILGNSPSVLAGRLAFLFDFTGPCLAVDTACSSSLLAVHLACQSLRRRECDAALAGGVNTLLAPQVMMAFSHAGFLAADGRCKTFDARADGYVRGEGCGVVVLRRLSDALEDGDRIWALVRGSASNQDGRSASLTAPNPVSQEAVIRAALRDARLEPARISYVEAHGTGTSLGDPIEMEALGAALGGSSESEPRCAVGSVKTNFGHLEAAAGVAALIKVALALDQQAIPPHLHFTRLNPRIALEGTRFWIPTQLTPWPAGAERRLAGVSSFGFSGTNAHVILEEAPDAARVAAAEGEAAGPWLLALSARHPKALAALAAAYGERLSAGSEGADALADVCFTASARRTHHRHRLAVVGADGPALARALEARVGEAATERRRSAKTVFVFSGQGSHGVGVGRELWAAEAVFRERLEACEAAYRQATGGASLAALLWGAEAEALAQTQVAQPLIFAVQVGLCALWRSWGIEPDAVVGHSVGEVAAAHVAGVLSLDEAMGVVVERGRRMQRVMGQGRMVAVALGAEALAAELGEQEEISVAAYNAPGSVVLSGATPVLEARVAALRARGIGCRWLPVDYAFHSVQMEPLRAELEEALAGLAPRPGTLRFFSTVTGAACPGSTLDAGYWGRNLRQPVRFAAAVDALAAAGFDTFVELGGHPVLAPALEETLSARGHDALVLGSLRRGSGERETLLGSLARLYEGGRTIAWSGLLPGRHCVVDLPRYPWQRERYWLGDPAPSSAELTVRSDVMAAAAVHAEPRAPLPLSENLRATAAQEGMRRTHIVRSQLAAFTRLADRQLRAAGEGSGRVARLDDLPRNIPGGQRS